MASECDFEAYRETPAPHAGDGRRGIDPPGRRPGPNAAEVEFLAAIREYKHTRGRMFPTWGEVLEVARGLGDPKPEGPSTRR